MSVSSEPNSDLVTTWRIYRRWGSAKIFVGVVAAPDAKSAIEKAVQEFNIADPATRILAVPREWK